MKRVAKIVIAAVMMVLCMSMISFAQEKIEVTNGNQLQDAFKSGGYVVVENNINIKDIDSLYAGKDILIDLNGNDLVINGGSYTFDANVCFMNGSATLFGKTLTVHSDTLAMKDGLLNLSQLELIMGDKADLLKVGEDAYIVVASRFYKSPIMALSVDGGLISGEMFMEMVKTGELPKLQKDGYSFGGWEALPGNAVTNWKDASNTDLIRATWSDKTASVFGSGNIWMIIAFIFMIISVVLGVVVIKKGRE